MNPWLIKARLLPVILYSILAGVVLFGIGVGVGMLGLEVLSKIIGIPGLAFLGCAALVLPVFLIAFFTAWGIDIYDSAAAKIRNRAT